jgi:hypothetical protein
MLLSPEAYNLASAEETVAGKMDGPEPHPLKILVVEDEPRYLESTRLLLKHYGHNPRFVIRARDDGEPSFEQIRARATSP